MKSPKLIFILIAVFLNMLINPALAFADDFSEVDMYTENLVIVDEKFTSYNELKGWKFSHDDHSTSYVEDNALVIKQIKSTPNTDTGAGNSAFSFYISKDFEGILGKDEEHNTEITATEFSGKYAIEFDLDYFVDTERANKTLYFIQLGYRKDKSADPKTMTETQMELRLGYNTLTVYHLTEDGTKKTFLSTPYTMREPLKIKVVFDTRTRTFDFYKNDQLIKSDLPYIYGTGLDNVFSAIRIDGLQASSVDSYLRIRNIKITRLEADMTDERYTSALRILELLPDTLVDNPFYVTENIRIPEINGDLPLTWSSGNTHAISNEGVINRWVDDINTYIQASFTARSETRSAVFNYVKKYYLRIPAVEGAASKVLTDESYSQDTDLKHWKFGSLYNIVDGKYILETDGITLEKVTPKNEFIFYDLKSFVAIKDFYCPDSEDTREENAALFNSFFSGIYDISFHTVSHVTGERPSSIEIGYFDESNNEFISFATVKFRQNTVSFITEDKEGSENSVNIFDGNVSGREFNLKFRMDTSLKRIWLYLDGVMVTPQDGIPYFDGKGLNCFNSVRFALDQNMNFGDYLKIKRVKLEQKLPVQTEEKKRVYDAASLLNVSAITDTPNHVVNSIKTLPQTVGDANITWETSDKYAIDIQTGKVYRGNTDVNVTLTAKITVGEIYLYKEFYLTVPKAEDPSELLEYYANKLDITDITNQDVNDIRYDIKLPTLLAEGIRVTWTSSDPSVIENNGKLNLNTLIKGNKTVTLTATITDHSGHSLAKSFHFNVKERGSNVNIYSADINGPVTEDLTIQLEDIEKCRITSDAFIKMTVTKQDYRDGKIYIKDSDGNFAVVLTMEEDGIKFGNIPLGTVGTNEEIDLKLFIMPDIDKFALWVNEELKLDNEDTLTDINDFYAVSADTDSIIFKNVSVDVDEYGVLQVNLDNIDYFSVFGTKYIRNSIVLNTNSILQTTVEWTSDHPNVLGNDGTLNVPDVYTIVNMNFKISGTQGNRVSVSKTISCIVPCDSGKNLALNRTFTGSGLEHPSYPITNINDGNDGTYYLASISGNGINSVTAKLDGKQWINCIYLNEPTDNIESYSVQYSDDGVEWYHLTAGNITDDRSRIITFIPVCPQYLRFNVLSSKEKVIRIAELEFYLFVDEREKVRLDIEGITLESDYVVISNITLPATGFYETPILWSSSHENILSSTGVLTKPKYDTEVILTAYAVYDGVRYEKQFVFYVKGTDGGKGASVVGGGNVKGKVSGAVTSIPAPVQSSNNLNQLPDSGIFNDVTPEMWFYEHVKSLKEKGIIVGDGNNNFRPDDNVTREQFLKMMMMAGNIELRKVENFFNDIDPSAWYSDYVLSAKTYGIVNGISENAFGIGQNITRQDMAVMIERFLEFKGIPVEAMKNELFADHDEISAYAVEAVYKMKAKGIIKGYNNEFRPQDALTRAEAAAVISTLMDLINE